MTVRVVNVNKAVGRASSGVEYAQRYRRELLAGIDWVDDRYLFTDYIGTNLCLFTDPLGFPRDRVLWIYDLVTGRATTPNTLTVPEFLSTLGQPHTEPVVLPDRTEVALPGSPVRYRIWTVADGRVDRVETHAGDQLVRAEHYDQSLNNIEHFHAGRLVRRDFLTPDGRVAATQTYGTPPEHRIVRTTITPASPLYDRPVRRGRPDSFRGDVLLEGRSAFFRYVLERVLDRPDDVVIVDRALDVIDAVYPVIGDRRLFSVVHAEHVDLKQLQDGVLLWNNHYEHVFTRPELVDGLIVSTRRQQEALTAQLATRFPTGAPPVVRIPVGIARTPAPADGYDPLALVTASRLAEEKHLDVLVRAVAAARATLPGLHLDIYGEGDRTALAAAIAETGTQDCVRLLGHRDLAGVLGRYALYVSASTSEGFGLSLLEALTEGLPVIGFDVDYGNRELIRPGVNGHLVPTTPGDPLRDVPALARTIVDTLTSGTLDDLRRAALGTAAEYGADRVRRLWELLLAGEAPC